MIAIENKSIYVETPKAKQKGNSILCGENPKKTILARMLIHVYEEEKLLHSKTQIKKQKKLKNHC